MQFLNPTWLFAAAAILIPVMIHLWNIRPGKVLKVGSTSLIQAASRRSSRSFKLLDIPLFLLRCLLLILLALLLALPVLQNRIKAAKARGWVLLPKEYFSETYTRYKLTVDSLTRAGYEFHFFNTGFPKADLAKLLAGKQNLKALDTTLQQPSAYWSLLKQLDSQIQNDKPVYLFTPNSASHFNGDRPEIGFNLNWKTFTPADSVSSWIQGAWFTNNNTIRVVKGSSSPSGIRYNYFTVSANKGDSQFAVNVANGQPVVSLSGSNAKPVGVDTSTLSIAVYSDKYAADAGYLKAALDAVAQFGQHKAVVKQYGSPNAIPHGQSWIFWLSDRPYAAGLLQKPAKIFAYQAGTQQSVNTWLSATDGFSLPDGSDQLPLFKRIAVNRHQGSIIWRDGFGQPLLSAERQDNAEVYRFYSHFNPTWNDMVWDSSFPKLMLQLFTNNNNELPAQYDRRALSNEQLQPAKITEQHIVADRYTVQKDLAIYFWLALAIVFMAERWLATQNKTVQSNG